MSYNGNLFRADNKTLGSFLFDDKLKFRIPRYQRPYSWGKEEAEDFWNDLVTEQGLSFIGSIVLNTESYKTDGYLEIIDGQQRLLTSTIFMSALRNVSKNIGDFDLADRIQRKTLSVEDKRGNHSYRLLCGDSLREYFEKTIQNPVEEKFSEPMTSEFKLVKDNRLFFETKIMDFISINTGEKDLQVKKINSLWDRLDNLNIIEIQISSDDDAYTVFETVNARGVDLTVADLLKNWIFKKIGIDDRGIDIARKKWTEIEDNIAGSGGEISKFILQYWRSKYAYLGERMLYRNIKKEIGDYEKFIEDLRLASSWYGKLLSLNKNDWVELEDGVDIFNHIYGTQIMRATQVNVMYLCLLRNKDKIPFRLNDIFRIIENFTFLYSGISKLQANKVEKIYSEIAVGIEEAINTSSEKNLIKNLNRKVSLLKEKLIEISPSRDSFIEKFMDVQYKNSTQARSLIRYIFQKINNEYYTTGELKIDYDQVNIEHIMPKTLSKNWNVTTLDHRENVDKLGNLCALSVTANSEVGNKGIDEKIKYLEKSDIALTKLVAKEITERGLIWGREEINNRQRQMSEIAFDKVWSL